MLQASGEPRNQGWAARWGLAESLLTGFVFLFATTVRAVPTIDFSYSPTPQETAFVTDSLGWPGLGRQFGQVIEVGRNGRLTALDFKILTSTNIPQLGNLLIAVYAMGNDSQGSESPGSTPLISGTVPIASLPVNTWQYVLPTGFANVPWTQIPLPGDGLNVAAGSLLLVALQTDTSLPGGAVGLAGGLGSTQGARLVRYERNLPDGVWQDVGYGWFLQSYVDSAPPEEKVAVVLVHGINSSAGKAFSADGKLYDVDKADQNEVCAKKNSPTPIPGSAP